MNIVPLGPNTMVRAPGWPCDQTSALKPAGSLSLSTGSFSSAVTVGGVACGFRFVSCLLASGFDLSRALKPGGVGGADGAGAGCCANAAVSPIANTPAAEASASRVILFILTFLPVLIDQGRAHLVGLYVKTTHIWSRRKGGWRPAVIRPGR